ncbi:MAG: SDR family oxidoreductase [Deltaproteobacteria bacterium]|nr:SDR family oxidoreductase [Deltaproteobacteria bacterium]
MKDLKGKNVIVTGGSRGIGLEIARAFLKEGANVFTIARNGDSLAASVRNLKKDVKPGRTVAGYSCDVGNREGIAGTIRQIASQNGGIDVVINNAGMYVPDYFERQDLEVFERTDRTNYLGAVFTTKAALPFLLERRRSAIVFVTSGAGLKGIFGYSSYSPTKAAVLSLAEVIKQELKGRGVQVAVLCPPDVDTPGHAEELKIRPTECNALSESGGLMTATEIAGILMSGFRKEKFLIIGGFETKLLYRLNGISPRFVDFCFERLIVRSRRNNSKKHPCPVGRHEA